MDETPQVNISIVCDKNHVAEYLRYLADTIEETNETITQHETYHGCAELDYEE
jgi:hypothetical protein